MFDREDWDERYDVDDYYRMENARENTPQKWL
jgi:hypothetical protein